ncbi:GAF domain-containing protein [Nocardioides sp.]|uniref:GAF domain-containing protein n=1 Tax=Nocardioides sp. TaxID=35761 RepID=UPI003783FFD4
MLSEHTHTSGTAEAAAGLDPEVRRLLAQVDTVPQLADVVRRAARAAGRADGATFVLKEDDRCFYVDEDSIAPLWKGQRFPISSCISGWAMLHGSVVTVPDITLDDRVPQDAYRPTFVRSLLMVPVGAQPTAAIGVYWAREHHATADEQGRVIAVAEAAAAVLDRIGLDSAPWAPSFGKH